MKKFLLLCVVSLFTSVAWAKNAKLQDVVYLKNGFVIRGMIIEQISGGSLKIKTREGNIFVCKMTEIIKIAQEPKLNRLQWHRQRRSYGRRRRFSG